MDVPSIIDFTHRIRQHSSWGICCVDVAGLWTVYRSRMFRQTVRVYHYILFYKYRFVKSSTNSSHCNWFSRSLSSSILNTGQRLVILCGARPLCEAGLLKLADSQTAKIIFFLISHQVVIRFSVLPLVACAYVVQYYSILFFGLGPCPTVSGYDWYMLWNGQGLKHVRVGVTSWQVCQRAAGMCLSDRVGSSVCYKALALSQKSWLWLAAVGCICFRTNASP